jgi:Ni,Fe-hydrogenase III large subunit
MVVRALLEQVVAARSDVYVRLQRRIQEIQKAVAMLAKVKPAVH